MGLFKEQYQADLIKVEPEEEITQFTKQKRGKFLGLGDLDEKDSSTCSALRKVETAVHIMPGYF